jgi:hypothetical protein
VLLLSLALLLMWDLIFHREGLELSEPASYWPWIVGRMANLRFMVSVGPALGVVLGRWWLLRSRGGSDPRG